MFSLSSLNLSYTVLTIYLQLNWKRRCITALIQNGYIRWIQNFQNYFTPGFYIILRKRSSNISFPRPSRTCFDGWIFDVCFCRARRQLLFYAVFVFLLTFINITEMNEEWYKKANSKVICCKLLTIKFYIAYLRHGRGKTI